MSGLAEPAREWLSGVRGLLSGVVEQAREWLSGVGCPLSGVSEPARGLLSVVRGPLSGVSEPARLNPRMFKSEPRQRTTDNGQPTGTAAPVSFACVLAFGAVYWMMAQAKYNRRAIERKEYI